jgi:PadR family transcriptional regulator AphA
LTYRCIDLLVSRGYVRAVGSEPGDAGPSRTILAATRTGRRQLRTWLTTPVAHLRDLRSELLLKLVLAENCSVDLTDMLERQRASIAELAAGHAIPGEDGTDVVALWRFEASHAATRFLDRLGSRMPAR